MCVKRKSPIQSPVSVCGRGGAVFHTQPVGNSSPFPLEGSFAYPAILYSLFSPATPAAEEKLGESSPGLLPSGSALTQRFGSSIRRCTRDGAAFSFAFMQCGTDLKEIFEDCQSLDRGQVYCPSPYFIFFAGFSCLPVKTFRICTSILGGKSHQKPSCCRIC